jgi:arylsulfatase
MTRWLLALALLLSGCEGGNARRDIVLVVIDTLRADSLPPYGAAPENAPNLAEFARGGVVFERVVAPSSWTKTSMASLLTGTNPSRHGVRGIDHTLPAELPTLARMLRDAGYRTLAVQTNPWLRAEFGFDAGFDRYDYALHGSAEEVNTRALALLEETGREHPVLLYLHYMDVHAPYRPGPRWFDAPALDVPGHGAIPDDKLESLYRTRRLRGPELDRRVRALYDAELRQVDHALGLLFEALRERGILERAVVFVTSDHGEAFGERGQVTHGRTFYPEVYAVPMLVRGGDQVPAGARIEAQVRSIDIVPTILGLAGVSPPPSVQGEALLPMEPAAIRARIAHGAVGLNDLAPDQDYAAVVGEESLYLLERRSGTVEFYDLRADPGALHDLGPDSPEAARLAQLVDEGAAAAAPGRTEIEAATRDQLESLGYFDPQE